MSCGRGGVRTRIVRCMDRHGRPTHDRYCYKRNKPKSRRKCRGDACPRWGVARWGRVSRFLRLLSSLINEHKMYTFVEINS